MNGLGIVCFFVYLRLSNVHDLSKLLYLVAQNIDFVRVLFLRFVPFIISSIITQAASFLNALAD